MRLLYNTTLRPMLREKHTLRMKTRRNYYVNICFFQTPLNFSYGGKDHGQDSVFDILNNTFSTLCHYSRSVRRIDGSFSVVSSSVGLLRFKLLFFIILLLIPFLLDTFYF